MRCILGSLYGFSTLRKMLGDLRARQRVPNNPLNLHELERITKNEREMGQR